MAAPLAPPLTLARALLSRSDGAHPALIDGDRVVSGDALAELVALRGAELALPDRSLVVLSGSNSLEFVVTYLALLDGGHVPLLAGVHAEWLATHWAAQAEIRVDGASLAVNRRDVRPHELHPELALLMSTSGSTGSPKLVRLSHRNLVSNARSIIDFQRLTERDCGITSLPLHYCYGLSVLHTHLMAGATTVLTDASVVDPCFHTAFHDCAVTNLAGVPHTYEMLERCGAERLDNGSLRLLTQAGGRLDPASVARWVERAERWSAEFTVMYGQTEATARIAFLPPEHAARRPGAIGVAVPGGELALRPVSGQPDGVGELVYRGPNVMMGYGCEVSDLASGPTLDELATGDLARFHTDDGVYEIVGRRSRFVKPFGLRIDLDHVERLLAARFVDADSAVTGDDERLVAMVPAADPDELLVALAEISGLPESRISIRTGGPIPRTASGKIDYSAIGALSPHRAGEPATGTKPLVSVFAGVLGRPAAGPSDSFVSLGGDSLSYVECSIALEATLGFLPPDWHLRPIGELTSVPSPRRRTARIDSTIALRAIGICLVVSTHMHLRHLPGGAHMLLAVAGYNLARFMTPIDSTGDRVRAGMRTAWRAAGPTIAWVAVGMGVAGAYSGGTLLLVNNYVGGASHLDDHWHFWFIEVFVHLVVLTTLLLAVPAVHRFDRRVPYGFPLVLLAGTLVLRLEWAQMGDWYNLRYRTHGVAWFFVLGWLIQRSSSWQQRAVTTVICLAVIPGFFRYAPREWMIAGALVGLVWLRTVPFPRRLIRPVGVLAAASMWIYVTHFTFWPVFTDVFVIEVAYVLTIAAGVGTSVLTAFTAARLAARWPAARSELRRRLLGLPNTPVVRFARRASTTPSTVRGCT